MDWNNNGRFDAGDYANYKMATESSNKSSSNNSSSNIGSDGGLKFLAIVIIVSIVYAILEAMTDMNNLLEKEAFIDGFRLGVKLVVEAIYDKATDI